MTETARGSFDVTMKPGSPELDGAVGRFDFTKTFHGDLQGVGAGLMLSGGDPANGSAGYIAIETVAGRHGDVEGSFALQQFGTMHAGSQTLRYEVVPGSGRGGFAGVIGGLRLTVDADGTHRYELDYEL